MILIKIALFGIPLYYYMSLFKAPEKLINKLENMRRNFLCGVARKKELFLHSGMEEGMFRLEKNEVWVWTIWQSKIKLYCRNGGGVLTQNRRLCGERY